jgi:hypothetical protein
LSAQLAVVPPINGASASNATPGGDHAQRVAAVAPHAKRHAPRGGQLHNGWTAQRTRRGCDAYAVSDRRQDRARRTRRRERVGVEGSAGSSSLSAPSANNLSRQIGAMRAIARMRAAGMPTASGGEPVNWSLLAQHQERDQHRDGREADRNDNDFEPRHAGSYAMPHGLCQGRQHPILALAAVRAKALRGPGAGL